MVTSSKCTYLPYFLHRNVRLVVSSTVALARFLSCLRCVNSDFGVHLDGWVAAVAHTVLATAEEGKPFTGRAADCVMACAVAQEAVLAAMKPGVKVILFSVFTH